MMVTESGHWVLRVGERETVLSGEVVAPAVLVLIVTLLVIAANVVVIATIASMSGECRMWSQA